ncbi:MAG: hypothetical protein IKQ17_08835 [Kiritimatiellae bacterium]|nr:hypothetical protein [Kiritimatiellia bacterium]
MEENQNVDRGRIVDDYKHSIIQSVEHDEMQHGDTAIEREQYNERSHQLDENETVAKEQYDNNHCEEVTGLSSDGYRHQVIEDYTHDKMAETSAGETQSADYWNDSSNETTSASTNAEQSEQVDYWADNSASNENSSEQDNSLSNEASC